LIFRFFKVTASYRRTSDRICKDVRYPIVHKLRQDELILHEYIDIDLLIHHLKNEGIMIIKLNRSRITVMTFLIGRLSDDAWQNLFDRATDLCRTEKNMIEINRGCTIIGDIHGQFYDLLHVFEKGGSLNEVTYVFLGDYVDRGAFSCECLILLMALKINHPKQIILLR
jgi:hypothetical protein